VSTVTLTAGQPVSIATSSVDFYDTIMVLLAPDGTPVIGSDDAIDYFGAFEWLATESGTYRPGPPPSRASTPGRWWSRATERLTQTDEVGASEGCESSRDWNGARGSLRQAVRRVRWPP
jgi:hypothetical protein